MRPTKFDKSGNEDQRRLGYMSRHKAVRGLAAAILSVSSMMLGACGDDDQISQEIQRADLVLRTATVSGHNTVYAPDAVRADLQWVVARLSGKGNPGAVPASLTTNGRGKDLPRPTTAPVDSSNPTLAGAASLMVARAQAGLAELQAREHVSKEAALVLESAQVRGAIDQWVSLHALASGLESYDPAKDLADLNAQIDKLREDQSRRESMLSEQRDKIEDLRNRAQQAADQAAAERDLETRIRSQMSGVSQTQRSTLLQDATKHRRQADAYDMQASNLLAEIEKEEPHARTLESGVDLVQQQIDLLRRGMSDLKDRRAGNRKAAEVARGEADEIARKLDGLITQGTGLREAADAPANDAVRLFEQAASYGKRAVKGASDPASASNSNLVSGNIFQSLGDVHVAFMRGLTRYQSVLTAAASIEPRLPNASSYAKRADDAGKAADEARKNAVKAYQDALAAYEKVKSQDIKSKVDDLKSRIEALANNLDPTIKTSAQTEAEDRKSESESDGVDAEAAPHGEMKSDEPAADHSNQTNESSDTSGDGQPDDPTDAAPPGDGSGG